MPKDNKHDNDSYGHTRMQTSAFRVCTFKILGEFTFIGCNIWLIFWRFTIKNLFLTLGFSYEFIKFIFTLRSIDVNP